MRVIHLVDLNSISNIPSSIKRFGQKGSVIERRDSNIDRSATDIEDFAYNFGI